MQISCGIQFAGQGPFETILGKPFSRICDSQMIKNNDRRHDRPKHSTQRFIEILIGRVDLGCPCFVVEVVSIMAGNDNDAIQIKVLFFASAREAAGGITETVMKLESGANTAVLRCVVLV